MGPLYDMHCHLIPGIDDGSTNIEESLEALRMEYEEGVRTIICTSHISCENDASYSTRLQDQMQLLTEQVSLWEHGAELNLYLGNELFYSDSIVEKLKSGEAHTMAGSHYVLVEFPPHVRYDDLYKGLRTLAGTGYLPILAHMERYDCLIKQKSCLEELQNLGIYLQVNATSLFGNILDTRVSYIRKILQEGYIHFLGTDSHGIHYRQPKLNKAARWIERRCAAHISEQILYSNPRAVLEDKII